MTVGDLIEHLKCYDKRDDVKIQYIKDGHSLVEEDISGIYASKQEIIIRGEI